MPVYSTSAGSSGSIDLVSGLYYGSAGSGTGTALTALRAYAHIFNNPKACSIDRIGMNVATSVAGALFRCCIWDDDGTGNYPGTLIGAGSSDLDASTTGTKEHTVAFDIPAGNIWLGLITNASGTFTPQSTHPAFFQGTLMGTTSAASTVTTVIGTIASYDTASANPFPSPVVTNIATPRVQFRKV